MVKIKRGSVLVLTLVLLMLMAGCGGSKAPAPAAPPPAPAAPAPPSPPSPPATPAAPAVTEESVTEILARGKNIDGLHFEFIMTGAQVKVEGKTWVQDKFLRNDMVADGQVISSIVDLEQGVAYTYMPEQKMAMKINIGAVDTDTFQVPTAYTENISPNILNVVETVTYDGRKCKVVSYAQGQEEVKMWLAEDYGIPVRLEITAGGEKTVIEYKNLKVGPIAPDVFKIPQGTQIIDMGS
jgi:outer membrane lipoprotein-sorting protein